MKVQFITPKLVCVCMTFMFLLDRFLPCVKIIASPYNLAGMLLILPGLGFTIEGVRLIRRAATTLHTFKQPLKLITEGPYRYTRNPIYLGLLLCLIGLWLILGTLSPLFCVATFFVVSNNWYIPFEEKMLATRFGTTYLSYQSRVRRWI